MWDGVLDDDFVSLVSLVSLFSLWTSFLFLSCMIPSTLFFVL